MVTQQFYLNFQVLPQFRRRCRQRMAFARGFLSCFYCGSKSSHRKDGSVQQWKCDKCLAVNYLDENGEITDPPVATFEEAPSTILYARPIQQSASPSPNSDDNVFCDECLRNQHLYTASLAQYLPDDSNHPDYARRLLGLDAYKRVLEDRYPQICAKCLPRVERRLKQSLYSAKSDHLRRMLDKSRNKPVSWTWKSWLRTLGGRFWWMGFCGQLLWDLLALAIGFNLFDVEFSTLLSLFQHTMLEIVMWSLLVSIVSSWWHPTVPSSKAQVADFSDWYWFQAFWIGLRIILWIGVSQGPLSDVNASVTKGAHIFMLGFSLFAAFFGRKSIKVKASPIFNYDPRSVSRFVRSSDKGTEGVKDPLSWSAAESITEAGVHHSSESALRGGYEYSSLQFHQGNGNIESPSGGTQPSYTSPNSFPNSLHNTFQDESFFESSTYPEYSDTEEMDWTPTHENSRNFTPIKPIRSEALVPNRSSAAKAPNAFWHKIPPAPVSLAQRLRNPPNQPRLIAPSPEAKESFFNRLTGRRSEITSEFAPSSSQLDNHTFAQPKFFPPEMNDITSGLADSFNTFTLKSVDTSTSRGIERSDGRKPSYKSNSDEGRERQTGGTSRHFWLAVILALMLLVWNHSLSHVILYTSNLPATIIGLCTIISVRSLMDYGVDVMAKETDMRSAVGVALAGIQVLMAGYVLKDLLIPGTGFEFSRCKSYGSILIGLIWLHEVCLACFLQFPKRNSLIHEGREMVFG